MTGNAAFTRTWPGGTPKSPWHVRTRKRRRGRESPSRTRSIGRRGWRGRRGRRPLRFGRDAKAESAATEGRRGPLAARERARRAEPDGRASRASHGWRRGSAPCPEVARDRLPFHRRFTGRASRRSRCPCSPDRIAQKARLGSDLLAALAVASSVQFFLSCGRYLAGFQLVSLAALFSFSRLRGYRPSEGAVRCGP